MTTLENRPNSALLVIDVQNVVVADGHEHDAVVGTIGGLVDRARREAFPSCGFSTPTRRSSTAARAGASSPN